MTSWSLPLPVPVPAAGAGAGAHGGTTPRRPGPVRPADAGRHNPAPMSASDGGTTAPDPGTAAAPASGMAAATALPRPIDDPRHADAAAFEAALHPLWQRAQAGDDAAYQQALTAIARRLRAWLRRRLQDSPDEIEDLVQETLLALHLQRGTWAADVTVTAWVLAIARHKLIDHWRRQGRRRDDLRSLDTLDEHEHPAAESPEPGARRDLDQLLRTLPAAQRDALLLTKVEGLSVAEAAERTGASVAAIKVQVHRGLKKLADLVRSPR
ncbi:MAG: hypothetical protein RLY78_238 [Pseudomonadota bacterium]